MNKYPMIQLRALAVVLLFAANLCTSMLYSEPVALEKTSQAQSKDKNVLFIVVDDLNKTLGTYGDTRIKTPNVDRLAKMGVQFEHAYCNYAVCNPSRSSFLTGLRPESLGVVSNHVSLLSVLGDKVPMINLFRKNGFYTMGLGKIFHLNNKENKKVNAWDEYYDFGPTKLGQKGELRNLTHDKLPWCHYQIAEGSDDDQGDGRLAKKAVELIKKKRDQPFFLAVGFKKPHDPYIAPKKYFDMYPLEDCDPPEMPKAWRPPYDYSLPGEAPTFNKFTDKDKRDFLRSYYACVSFMDAQVGKVLDALEESGQMDNTLIVFFSDHGYHLGEHNWWNKVTVYEKGTSAPFIVVGQSVGAKGVKCESMFEYIDIYPTLADVFNLKGTPDYLEGKSFAHVLNDPSLSFRSEVRSTTNRGDKHGRMVKNKDWRYIDWDGGLRGHELYDQHKDPLEYHNLADHPEYKSVVDKMKLLINQ